MEEEEVEEEEVAWRGQSKHAGRKQSKGGTAATTAASGKLTFPLRCGAFLCGFLSFFLFRWCFI